MSELRDHSAVLTHHWLVRERGGEKVLRALCEVLPQAPLYTLVHDAAQAGAGWPTVHTSVLQRLPGATRHYPRLLPLLPWAARRMRLPDVDLVVCSDAAIAKAMRPHPRSRVVCYCHSPIRYAYEPEIGREYARTLPAVLRPLWGPLVAYVRRADLAAARRVDQFVANSRHVAERIRRHYGRDSVVVYPPVELPAEPATGPRGEFYLCVGYHVAYKRLDLAVEACRRLGRRLVVIGDGPDVARLKATAGSLVEWLGWQTPERIAGYYREAAGLLFPGEEDFGIVPVEAMAHGCPVIAYGVGGACETVIDGEWRRRRARREEPPGESVSEAGMPAGSAATGVLFGEATVESLIAAIERAERSTFDPAAMHAAMQQFSRSRFVAEMRALLERVLAARMERAATAG